MNTETTESDPSRGWLFYDAACPTCRTALKLVGPLFARRGFRWLPLQGPDVAQRLGLSQAALLVEMKLQLPDRRVLGGIDSWIVLLRSVWWLWPLGALLGLPGFHAFGQRVYRWVARHRYCVGGRCSISSKPRAHRKIPFLDLP